MEEPRATTGYRQLLAVPGLTNMVITLVLGRTADSAFVLVLVLFILERFNSAGLAGLASFCLLIPGKVVSPLAGALLDRTNRRNVIVVNYAVAATIMAAVVLLDRARLLSPLTLCLAMVLLGITSPIGDFGMRALFPAVVPRHLWDRANAIDSSTYVIASLLGPPGGGIAIGLLGPDAGVLLVAATLALAALVGLGVHDVRGHTQRHAPIFAAAWDGLLYVVVRNRSLRGLAVVISLLNVSGGMVLVGIPVLVERHFHQSAQTTGLVLACFGLAGLASALLAGRLNTENRERLYLALGNVTFAAGIAAIAFAPTLSWLVFALVISGVGNGPCDVALFSLRQRRTDPHYFGRAMAISMSLNTVGMPVGAALAGAMLAAGYNPSLWILGAVLVVVGVVLLPVMIPRAAEAARLTPQPTTGR